MEHAADARADARGQPLSPPAGYRARHDIGDARARRDGENRGCDEEGNE
jgi:hypothetical protein